MQILKGGFFHLLCLLFSCPSYILPFKSLYPFKYGACNCIRNSAKSIAACKLHLQKKLHGGLRCEKRGWHLKYKSCTQILDFKPFLLIASLSPRNSASAAPQNQANCTRRKISLKICAVGCDVLRGVGY